MMLSPAGKSIVAEVINLLETKGWCQEYYALDKFGSPVHEKTPEACHFCGLGALNRVTPLQLDGELWNIREIFGAVHGVTIIKYNDAPGRTKAEVISAFKELLVD